MRKIIAMFFATALVATSAYAVEPQQMDESTNPNTNTDMKTQNMQQKPNAENDSSSGSTHHKKGYRHSKKHHDSNSGTSDSNTTTDTQGSSSNGY